MNVISYSQLRSKLAEVLDQVNQDHEPVIITRQNGGPPSVLMSLKDFNSYEETDFLIRNPKNAKRLTDAMHDIAAGNYREHELLGE